ncbi:MAG: ABC transporter permease, partial [Ruminococcus sp.]|nr:ABC transporter permease [Ruminococcus sp.]
MIAIISVIVLLALLVVSLVIIYNTTRASVDFRKKEINIMKYVGATNTFIKIPFFIEGMLMGILAGGIATLLTWLGYRELTELLMRDTTIWSVFNVSSFIPLEGTLLIAMALCYVASGAVIGAIGTVMSTGKYLKV